MKLIVQIPCLNEAATLPLTIGDIPRSLPGVTAVELLVIDDGSTDGTADVARNLGVHHIVRNSKNAGLAASFRRGVEACLAAGADIIVNTDADNQYVGSDIAKLIQPILENRADIVIGDRQTRQIEHFSPFKRLLQRIGSGVVRKLAGIEVPDAVSGFRAMSREAAQQINILTSFSYTTEMVIQAANRGIVIQSVPVRTNSPTRESRLFRSAASFIRKSATTIIRTYAMYRPMRVFFAIGASLFVIGAWPLLRFLYFYVQDGASGHVQSLVIGGVLMMMGFMSFMIGLMADLLAVNRQLQERTLYRIQRLELKIDANQSRSDASRNSTTISHRQKC